MNQSIKIISAVDHVVEPPDVWTRRLSKAKFGDRMPHLERSRDDGDFWIVDGRQMALADTARVGALMTDRAKLPNRWEEIPKVAYDRRARLKAMGDDGVDYAVLYPSLTGFSGEVFGADAELELACVQAYTIG